MDFFNKEKEVVRKVPPVRSLHYKPVPVSVTDVNGKPEVVYSKPYLVRVGWVFPVKNGSDLEVTDIIFAEDIFRKSGSVKYDVYVKKVGENINFIWKTLPSSDNLHVEYFINFD